MLTIRWRPSGGRGEYEYTNSDGSVLGKGIHIRIPLLQVDIPTDVRFDFKDGKPRLRRDNPADRGKLNVPNLVAAIAALPGPRREDLGPPSLPLTSKSYVIESISCEVRQETESAVVLEPLLLKPKHLAGVDLEERVSTLLAMETQNAEVHALLEMLRSGDSSANVATLAGQVHAIVPIDLTEQPGGDAETDEIVTDFVGSEGKVTIKEHRVRERAGAVVTVAKRRFKRKYGKLFCECCGLCFEDAYLSIGNGFIEAHHKVPLGSLNEETQTKPDDLMMMCANCHRMVHREPDCNPDTVRAVLYQTSALVSPANIELLSGPE